MYESFLCPGGQVMEYCHHWGHIETEKAELKKNIAKGIKDPSVDCICQSKGTNINNKITPSSDQTISIFWQNVKIVSSNCCQDVSCH